MVGILKSFYNYGQKSCNFIYERAAFETRRLIEDVHFTIKYHPKSIAATAIAINAAVFRFLGSFHDRDEIPNIRKAAIITYNCVVALLLTVVYRSVLVTNGYSEPFKNFKRLRTLDKTKKVAENTILILQTTYDHNGGFAGKYGDVFDLPKLEKAGYNLIFKDITTKKDIQDSINHVAGKAKAIWFRMHGSPGYMEVSENEVFSYHDVNKMAPTLKKLKNCRIVLHGCSTGSPNGKNPNIKEAFEKLGFEVDAPNFDSCGAKVASLNPLKVEFIKHPNEELQVSD